MNLQETEIVGTLYNIYGALLTDKQQQIFENYIFDNFSLAEIAENFGISRQAVLDCVNKSCKQLKKYEQMLKIIHNNDELRLKLELIKDNIKVDISKDKIINEIDKIIENL